MDDSGPEAPEDSGALAPADGVRGREAVARQLNSMAGERCDDAQQRALVHELWSLLEQASDQGRAAGATLPMLLDAIDALRLFDRMQSLSLVESLVIEFAQAADASPGSD